MQLQNFSFDENLVRAIDRCGDPWFVGRDVCQALHIRNENDALATLDDDEREAGVAIPDPSGTKYAVIISEPGVYRLVFRSRKPEAERFKRWLAHDVLPQLRRGVAVETPAPTPASDTPETSPLMHRLQVVREARCLFGREVAQSLWRKLALPPVPPPPRTAIDEARECLRHILDLQADDGRSLRELLALALEDGEVERLVLQGCGVRAYPDHGHFVIANQHPWLSQKLKGTDWATPLAAMRVLRRLPEAKPSGPVRIGPLQPRGTILTADVLDEFVR